MKKFLIGIFLTMTLVANAQYSNKNRVVYSSGSTGVCLAISGFAFTTAAILEGPYNYPPKTPFFQQTPRQIMLCTGVTLTVTGLITMGLEKKRKY